LEKTRVDQQFGEFVGVQLTGMERVDRGVAAGGEGDPVGGGHHQRPRRTQHPQALPDKLTLIPQVLDDLEVDHHVHRRVGQR